MKVESSEVTEWRVIVERTEEKERAGSAVRILFRRKGPGEVSERNVEECSKVDNARVGDRVLDGRVFLLLDEKRSSILNGFHGVDISS